MSEPTTGQWREVDGVIEVWYRGEWKKWIKQTLDERALIIRDLTIEFDNRRETISSILFAALVSSWSKRSADGMPDYAFYAREAVKAAEELLMALEADPTES
jgi:hypothetical protein